MNKKNALDDYYAALGRLESGCPNVLPPGGLITNDAVSIEAGRRKGSIKKSRPKYIALIAAIEEAARKSGVEVVDGLVRKETAPDKEMDLRAQLDAALGREYSLLMQLFEIREQLHKASGDRVVPLRKRSAR